MIHQSLSYIETWKVIHPSAKARRRRFWRVRFVDEGGS